MEESGWSWPELMATPHLVVEEFVVRRNARTKWQAKKREIDAAKNKK